MVNNPFDVTQVHKGPQAPKFAPPAAAAAATAAAQAPAEAPAPVIEETVEQDVYQAGEATATVDTPPSAAARVQLPPQVQELKEQIEGAGSHREELQDELEYAVSCFEDGEYAEAADLLDAIQGYLDLREEISSATGLSQARKNDLRQKAWQEYQGIAEDVRNGEPLGEFTTTRQALLNARLDFYQGKHWGAGFTDFLENIDTAIENGNFQAAEALLKFCDTVLAAKKMIKQLTTVIDNGSIPQDVRDLYTQARAELRREVEDILAGNLGQAQEHAERAQQKLTQAQDQIADINAAREAEVQAAYSERAGYLIDNFGPNTDVFATLEEGLGEEGEQLCPLFEKVEAAREQGHFDAEALEALDKLSQLLRTGAQAVNRQQIFEAADQIRDYLAQLSQSQSTGGTSHVLALRTAASGTIGMGIGLATFAQNGTGTTALAHQQTLYQYLEALSASHDPEAQAAYQDLVAQLLDLDACRSVYDLSVLLDNFLYLRETGHLPPALQSVQSQNAFLQRIAQHPVVQRSLNDIETGKVVQIVESIAIVIVAAATAEIGGGFIAAELGIGGGAGGFLLTQAIVAPIFTLTNGLVSQGLGLSEGWETPVGFLENVATDYLMFVTLGAVAKGYAMLFRAPATPVGKIFYQGGSFAAEYLAFNGFTFAEQAVGSAFSEELTLSYVFSSQNVQQVFMDNAVMLIGLKIGNFIAKPIISPLREGILERTRPDLAQEARQLDVQGQALAERLAEYQLNGGTGEKYVDIRADQISQLQARVDFLKEIKESGFATEAEVREAEAALESATVEYGRLQEANIADATIEPAQAEATPAVAEAGTAVLESNASPESLPIVTADMVVPRSQLMQVAATYEGAQFELPSTRNGTAVIGGLTFRRVLFPAWEVSFSPEVESLTLRYTENGVPQTANPVVESGKAFISCLGDGSVSLEVSYADGTVRTIDIQRPMLSQVGIVSSYDLNALDNIAPDIAYQTSGFEPQLFALGQNHQIWAKGMGGADKYGLPNTIAAALDGEVRSGSVAYYGNLSGDAQVNNVSAGPHGPCYVVLDGQPSTANVGAEHHVAYLVPNNYAKGLFERSVREALDAHIITTEQAETILSKVFTHEEYIAHFNDPAFVNTEVAQSVTVNDQTVFAEEQGFMTFLEDANAQFYNADAQGVAAEHWAAMQAQAAELNTRYPGIPLYEAQALDLVRARLSDLSPVERQQLIDLYGTDRPEIFFGDTYPDINKLITGLENLMHTLGVGLDPGFPLCRDIAQIKSRLEALRYTIQERYGSSIPASWWANVSLDMAEPFSYAINNLRESAGYIVIDAPALETYPVEVEGKMFNVELRDLEYPADGHHEQGYFLADPQTGEVFSHLFVKPEVSGTGNIRIITVRSTGGKVYGQAVVSSTGNVEQIPTSVPEEQITTSPDVSVAIHKNAKQKKYTVKP